jgi:dihydropyrimidinase
MQQSNGLDLIVRGGTLVTDGGTYRMDVGVVDGRIAAVGDLAERPAARVLDAAGCIVLPGLVDPHTHMTGVGKSFGSLGEGLRVTSRAALCGGTTTILQMAPAHPESIVEDVERLSAEHAGSMATDFAVHPSLHAPVTDARQLTDAIEAGITSFYASLAGGREGRRALDDGALMQFFEWVAEGGAMAIVHAENTTLNEDAVRRLEVRGALSLARVGDCHPWYSEGEAARRAAFLAEVVGGHLYIEHLSTAPALDAVRQAQARGHAVFAETCPHYLAFNQEMYATERAVEFLKSPPLRRPEDQAALWEGMLDGTVYTIGTDESTALKGPKTRLLERAPVYEVSGGLNAIEVRLPVIYTELVVRRGVSPTRVVQLLSSNPARLFGLYPQKGSLRPGADADLIVVDPTVERPIANEALHQGTDHTIFEGWVVRGWPREVVFRGEVVVQGGEPVGEPVGRWLPRRPVQTRWEGEVLSAEC